MIKNIHKIRDLQESLLLDGEDLPFEKKMQIFEWLWNEGVSLGVLPLKDALDGIETDIKLAKILNSCS